MKKFLYTAITYILMIAIPAWGQSINIPDSSPQQKPAIINNTISKSSFYIDVIDPTPETNRAGRYYPGLRGANQLIIYTPKFGKRTQTNEYGKEALVIDNTVVKISSSNSFIPDKGFVISGHGRAKKWIDDNLIIGAKIRITIDKRAIKSYIVPESYTFQSKQKIKEVESIINDYKTLDKNYDAKKSYKYLKKAKKELEHAEKLLTERKYEEVKKYASNASELADKAVYYAIPYKIGEFKGIWIRPTEKSPEEIKQTLDSIQKAGINNVFLETYYHGYTIFPSETLASYGVKKQREEFSGWDPLKVWITQAHKRNMNIHTWFQTFYVGNEDISKIPNHVLSVYPNWANVQRRNYLCANPMPSVSEHNGYFLDPANPEVQNYLIALLQEIADNYDVDGINIDYIRYPASLSMKFPNYLESTWGYTNHARREFFNINQIDPAAITQCSPQWQSWVKYRQNKVTNFVSKLKSIKNGKNIEISTVIFPDSEDSAIIKLQDWQAWSDNEYIDSFTPLVLGGDESLASYYMQEIEEKTSGKIPVYAGVFQAFTSGSPVNMLLQVKALRGSGASGVVIFDYAHLSKDFITALTSRIFKAKQD